MKYKEFAYGLYNYYINSYIQLMRYDIKKVREINQGLLGLQGDREIKITLFEIMIYDELMGNNEIKTLKIK